MGGLLRLVQRRGDWAGPQPTQVLLAVLNVTVHPSTASDHRIAPLLCGFDVPIEGLMFFFRNCFKRARKFDLRSDVVEAKALSTLQANAKTWTVEAKVFKHTASACSTPDTLTG